MSVSCFFYCCQFMSCRLVKDCFYFMGGKEGCFTCHYSSRVFTCVAWQIDANEMVQREEAGASLHLLTDVQMF